jgi:hypothetical protein
MPVGIGKSRAAFSEEKLVYSTALLKVRQVQNQG